MKETLSDRGIFTGLVLFLLIAWPGISLAEADNPRLGYDNCLGCHDNIAPRIVKTPHTPVNQVLCVDCHGTHGGEPGAENIRTLKQTAAPEVFSVCTRCHRRYSAAESSHAGTGRACLSCHDMWHGEAITTSSPVPREKLIPPDGNRRCRPCHARSVADFNKPFHHQSGSIGLICRNCHDPHRSAAEIERREIDRKCVTCHPDTGGPFMFVHMGGAERGCVECHLPHGGVNPNLLNRSTVRFLCLSCHDNSPMFVNQADPKYRQCTSCHPAIHGSNLSDKFFQ